MVHGHSVVVFLSLLLGAGVWGTPCWYDADYWIARVQPPWPKLRPEQQIATEFLQHREIPWLLIVSGHESNANTSCDAMYIITLINAAEAQQSRENGTRNMGHELEVCGLSADSCEALTQCHVTWAVCPMEYPRTLGERDTFVSASVILSHAIEALAFDEAYGTHVKAILFLIGLLIAVLTLLFACLVQCTFFRMKKRRRCCCRGKKAYIPLSKSREFELELESVPQPVEGQDYDVLESVKFDWQREVPRTRSTVIAPWKSKENKQH